MRRSASRLAVLSVLWMVACIPALPHHTHAQGARITVCHDYTMRKVTRGTLDTNRVPNTEICPRLAALGYENIASLSFTSDDAAAIERVGRSLQVGDVVLFVYPSGVPFHSKTGAVSGRPGHFIWRRNRSCYAESQIPAG